MLQVVWSAVSLTLPMNWSSGIIASSIARDERRLAFRHCPSSLISRRDCLYHHKRYRYRICNEHESTCACTMDRDAHTNVYIVHVHCTFYIHVGSFVAYMSGIAMDCPGMSHVPYLTTSLPRLRSSHSPSPSVKGVEPNAW